MRQEKDDGSIHWSDMIDSVRKAVIRSLPYKPISQLTNSDLRLLKLENLLTRAKIAMLRYHHEPNDIREYSLFVTRERYLYYLEELICKN